MEHPGELWLQRHLDAELDEEAEERIRSHLRVCAACRALTQEHARLSAMVRASAPEREAFIPEGEFWTQISGRLTPRPTQPWPLLPLLPPLLLAALGSVLQVALTVVVGLFGLGALGLLPTPTTVLERGIANLVDSPFLGEALYRWFGLSSAEVAASAAARWTVMDAATQHVVLLAVAAIGLVAALAAVVVLYVTWAMCWPGAVRHVTEGGS